MRKALTLLSIALVFSIALGIPAQPHRFWGTVSINGVPAPDGTVVDAKISGELVATQQTVSGWYGTPVSFYIYDDEGVHSGKTIMFYVGGAYAANFTFKNGGTDPLNLSITTECGNTYCEPGETSNNCCDDCGCPSGYNCEGGTCVAEQQPPPEPYCGDGNCDAGEDCSSCPSDCGTCTGGGGGGGGGGGYVPPEEPEEEEPYCGDGTCNEDENCATCQEDCGACPPECTENADCGDGDACTTDKCEEGSCKYLAIGSCQNDDDCCPGACTITSDNDCPCADECTAGQDKCENNSTHLCVQDEYGCYNWEIIEKCEEGCCGAACCGEERIMVTGEVVATAEDQGGQTTLAGITGAVVSMVKSGTGVLIIILVAGIIGTILFIVLKKNRKQTGKKTKKK
jgi:hypothetical protein